MSDFDIRPDWQTAEVKALMENLRAPRLNRALSVAVNASARQLERYAERLLAKRTSLPSKRTKTGVWVRPFSTPETLTATVRGSATLIPLKVFKVRETKKGVRAKIMGEMKTFPGAFIRGGTFPNRTELPMSGDVFKRRGKSRLPIDKMQGVRLSEAMADSAVADTLKAHGTERLLANVMRQLDRYTRSRKGRPVS